MGPKIIQQTHTHIPALFYYITATLIEEQSFNNFKYSDGLVFTSKIETFISSITLILNAGYKIVSAFIHNFGAGNS